MTKLVLSFPCKIEQISSNQVQIELNEIPFPMFDEKYVRHCIDTMGERPAMKFLDGVLADARMKEIIQAIS